MMPTDEAPRFFPSDAAVRHVGGGLLARTLPRSAWTHEAHLAATLYLLRERPDIDVDGQIAGIISQYNVSVGGVNDDTQGYHETITRAYVHGIRKFLASRSESESLSESVNALLASATGRRDWPMNFYSRDVLFSVAARRQFIAPDLAPLPSL